MKKVLSFIVALTMICTVFAGISAYAADDAAFRLTSATAKAGETVTLSMMVDNNPGITACAVAIEYPAGLTLTAKATNKNLFSGGSVVVGGNPNENPYKVNWSEDFDNFYESGEFFTVTFKVADDAQPGDYEIVVSYDQADVYDSDFNDVVFATVNGVITVEDDAPVAPTAADLGLFTDDQVLKVAENVMTSNGYSINKALAFVSGIYADAAVITYGTEIGCDGYAKVIDIPAVNTYEAAENVKGFVAAVTSIRNDNLNKAFTAKAYADVTVGEETVRVYAEDVATAVYAN